MTAYELYRIRKCSRCTAPSRFPGACNDCKLGQKAKPIEPKKTEEIKDTANEN